MKTHLKSQNKTFAIFGLIMLAVVTLFIFAAAPVAGVAMAMAGAAGTVDLTPEEQKFVDAIVAKMEADKEKYLKGYITETKLNELLTAKFNEIGKIDPTAIDDINEKLNSVGLEIKSIKEKGDGKVVYKSFGQQFKEKLNGKSLLEVIGGGQKFSVDIDLSITHLKDVGTVARPTGTSWLPPAVYDTVWGVAPLNRPTIRSIADVGTTALSRAIWSEGGAREGTAGETAEGATKNQIDNTPTMKYMDAKKLTGFYNFTDEILEDMPGFLTEMEKEIMGQIETKEDSQFIVGTGLTKYLKGIKEYAQAFTLTNTEFPVTNPNTFDAINAAIAQVEKNNFVATGILINPLDAGQMRLAKTASTYEYLLLSPAGEIVPGVTVIKSNNIPQGTICVGDFTKYHIRDYKTLNLRFGYVGNNFTDNIQTAIGEKRVIAYVKGGEEGAFVYSTITAIKEAITPAS